MQTGHSECNLSSSDEEKEGVKKIGVEKLDQRRVSQSLTLFTETRAITVRSENFHINTIKSTQSKGSNGASEKAFRTMDRSQEGITSSYEPSDQRVAANRKLAKSDMTGRYRCVDDGCARREENYAALAVSFPDLVDHLRELPTSLSGSDY